MHELSLAGAVLSLRLLLPAVPGVERCPLSSGCEHGARALGGWLEPWHTVAEPCRAPGLEWEGELLVLRARCAALCPEQPQLQPVAPQLGDAQSRAG